MNIIIIAAIFCSESKHTVNIFVTAVDKQIYIFVTICYAGSIEASFPDQSLLANLYSREVLNNTSSNPGKGLSHSSNTEQEI